MSDCKLESYKRYKEITKEDNEDIGLEIMELVHLQSRTIEELETKIEWLEKKVTKVLSEIKGRPILTNGGIVEPFITDDGALSIFKILKDIDVKEEVDE
jgi:hypothetical protein